MNPTWLALAQKLDPRAAVAAMAALVALTLLAAHFYVFAPSIASYRLLAEQWSPGAVAASAERAEGDKQQILVLRDQVESLSGQLYGGPSGLPREQMEAFVIARLDRLASDHAVRLVTVSPGAPSRVLVFDEVPYDIEVSGDYFDIYRWLHSVERELRPMAVKRFEMRPEPASEFVAMQLRLVSYRPQKGKS